MEKKNFLLLYRIFYFTTETIVTICTLCVLPFQLWRFFIISKKRKKVPLSCQDLFHFKRKHVLNEFHLFIFKFWYKKYEPNCRTYFCADLFILLSKFSVSPFSSSFCLFVKMIEETSRYELGQFRTEISILGLGNVWIIIPSYSLTKSLWP